jgi:hypothetical protein
MGWTPRLSRRSCAARLGRGRREELIVLERGNRTVVVRTDGSGPADLGPGFKGGNDFIDVVGSDCERVVRR